MEKRVLVVEDEDSIRKFIIINLERAGYSVTEANSAEEALKIIDGDYSKFDVAVLDVMMTGMNGFELCKLIRENNDVIGIVMLTAKSQEMDKISGFMYGADDYVTKPFSPYELTVRIDAVFRRVKMGTTKLKLSNKILQSGDISIDTNSRNVFKGDEMLELTQVELHLLEFFIKNKNRSIDRATIIKEIWGDNYFGDDKILDVNIRRLRMKIERDPSMPMLLQTVRGYGYKWIEE